jgi:prepilin-type N-terminal cleavage/methylation domain-containing protein
MRTHRTGAQAGRLCHWGISRAAFTLIELLIVISIFVLLLAIGVPAFSSMLYSSEQASAENALKIGLASARDAAIRAGSGRDGAAVFVFEEHRLTIVPCLKAGEIGDVHGATWNPPNEPVTREVFAPVTGFEPVKLPRNWTVRGYATPNMIDEDWYERTYPNTNNLRQTGHWVFPETDYFVYDDQYGDRGDDRQTFMVRFEGGTGMLKADPGGVLVLLPGESTYFRGGPPWSTFRADEQADGARFVARVLSVPWTGAAGLSEADRRKVLGDISDDTILTKGVTQLALCNEKALAAALGVALDKNTGTIYVSPRDETPPLSPIHPTFVTPLRGIPQRITDITKWIEGRYPDAPAVPVPSEARLFTVQRYSGLLQEVTGTANGNGVTQ